MIDRIRKIVSKMIVSSSIPSQRDYRLLVKYCYKAIQSYLLPIPFDSNNVKIVFLKDSALIENKIAFYRYVDRTIYIANPVLFFNRFPLLHLFISATNETYIDMFIIVFVHELVHAYQHQNTQCDVKSSCEKESHACYVAKQFSKKYNIYDIYQQGERILSLSHSIKSVLSGNQEPYDFFRKCYLDSNDSKYDRWKCK